MNTELLKKRIIGLESVIAHFSEQLDKAKAHLNDAHEDKNMTCPNCGQPMRQKG